MENEPALAARPLNEQLIRSIAEIQRIADLTLRNTRITTADQLLDPVFGPSLIREALENGCLLLFIEVALGDYATLRDQLGEDLHRVDESVESPFALCAIRVDHLAQTVLGRTAEVRAELEGMSTVRMHSSAIRSMPSDIGLQRACGLSRMLSNPKFTVYLVVFIYSSLRALPVAFIKEFHGNLFILWSIDIITAVPYTWGVLTMLFAKRWQMRALGTLTTVVTFASPYVYFWLHGRDYPPFVAVIIAALTLLSVGMEFIKFRQERSMRARYSSVEQQPAQEFAA
ncbi:hypothetical protein [Glutamicibacter sp.]|uniref:hypothetical protein n=1 Tax=Glutamicibacter sp. TaxID=1931995 RepID=UPI0028BD93A5|nr:hypothetical protein [Glutamicibacter sp.]